MYGASDCCTAAVAVVGVGSGGAHNVLSVGTPPVAETSSADAMPEKAVPGPGTLVIVVPAVIVTKGEYTPHDTGVT